MSQLPLHIKTQGSNHARNSIVFVGGSGDDKDSFDEVIAKLVAVHPEWQYVTFSFRGVDERSDLPLHQQVNDLEEVIKKITKGHEDITVVTTSMGAYSTAHVITQLKLPPVARCIFVDPADYTIDKNRLVSESRSWSGVDMYNPSDPTASMKMGEITGTVKVDVVHFTLKNYTANGYVPKPMRGVDNEGAVSRLNSTMVRSFFDNTPARNQGVYLIDNQLPHAFMRDGDIKKNVDTLTNLLIQLFK